MGGSKSKVSIGPEKRWCWGELSTKFAVDILLHPLANTGDFLVRNSRQLNGSYCISVRAEADKVKHFPIYENDEGYFVIQPEWIGGAKFSFIEFSKGTGMTSHKFESMQDLLQGLLYGGKHARTAFKHFGCFLIRCVPKGESKPAASARGAVGGRSGRPTETNKKKRSNTKQASRKVSAPPVMFSASPVLSKKNLDNVDDTGVSVASVNSPRLHPLGAAPKEVVLLESDKNRSSQPQKELEMNDSKLPPSNTSAFIRNGNSNIKRGATSFAVGSTRSSNAPPMLEISESTPRGIDRVIEQQPITRRARASSVDTGTKQRYVNVITILNHTAAEATAFYPRDQPPTPPAEEELPGQKINFDQTMYDKRRKEQARLRLQGRSDLTGNSSVTGDVAKRSAGDTSVAAGRGVTPAVYKPDAVGDRISMLGTYETKPFPEYDEANNDHDDSPYDKCPTDWAGEADPNAYATMSAVNTPTTYVNKTFDRSTVVASTDAAGSSGADEMPRYVNMVPGMTVASGAGARSAAEYDNGDAFAGGSDMSAAHVPNHSVGEYDRAVDGMVDMSKSKNIDDDELGFC